MSTRKKAVQDLLVQHFKTIYDSNKNLKWTKQDRNQIKDIANNIFAAIESRPVKTQANDITVLYGEGDEQRSPELDYTIPGLIEMLIDQLKTMQDIAKGNDLYSEEELSHFVNSSDEAIKIAARYLLILNQK